MRNAVLYLPAQIFFPLLQLLLVLVWAHLLPERDVGIATLSIAIQDILYALIFTALSQYTLRHLARIRRDNAGVFLSWEPYAVLGAACLQTVLALPLIAQYFDLWGDPWLCVILGMQGVSRSVLTYFADRSRADGHISTYSFIQIGTLAFSMTASVGLILFHEPTVKAAAGGVLLAQLACLLVVFALTDFGRGAFVWNRDLTVQTFKYGLPISLATLLTVSVASAPRFIVDHMFGLSLAGSFAVSYALGLRVSSFLSTMVIAGAYPAVVRKLEEEGLPAAYAQLCTNTLILVGLTVPAAAGLAIFIQPISSLLLPAGMVQLATTVVPLAVASGVLRDIRVHCSNQVFLLRSKSSYSLRISLLDFAVAIPFSIIGTLLAGLPGTLLGLIVSSALSLAVSIYFAKAHFGFEFPLKAAIPIVVACTLMAVVGWLMPSVSDPRLVAVEIAVTGLSYIIVVIPMYYRRLSGIYRSD